MNTIMWIVTGVCFFLLVAGFLIGFFRNWLRSSIRLSIVVISFTAAFFLAPILINSFINKIVVGNTLSIFNFTVDFENIAKDFVGESFGEDLSLVTVEISEIAKAMVNVVANVLIFLITFVSLVVISLVIYWIVLLIVKLVQKKNNTQKEKQKNIGLRFVGAFEGFVTALIICFSLMMPVFGVMNICNEFLDESKNKKPTEQVASAYTPSNSLICGQLYYTEDEAIGKVEGLIETYAQIKKSYDKSPIGFIFKYTGLRKVGTVMFNHLTNVKINGEKVKFGSELVSVIKTYNLYKDTFIKNEFNIQNNESLDNLIELLNQASESKVAENLVEKILPVVAERFADGEKFFGFTLEVEDQYKVIVSDALEVFKATTSISRINYNAKTIVETLKVVNSHNFIENVQTNGLIEALNNDKTIVKDVISKIAVTEEIKNNLPVILNDLVEVLYNQVVGEKDFENTKTEFDIENWEDEASKIQGIVTCLLDTYTNILKDENVSQDAMIDELPNIGKTIDIARTSVILSDSVQEFMIGLLNSDKVNFGDNDASIKESLTNYINEKWSVEENPNFKFEETFKVLGDTAKIATNLNTEEGASIEEMGAVLENILKDENLKEETLELLKNDEIISSIVGDNDTAVVVKDVVATFVENSSAETLEQDLKAGQAVLDLVSLNQDSEFTKEKAEELIETVVSSEAVISVLESANNSEDGSSLKNLIDENISDSRIIVINTIIQDSETLSDENRALLESLFSRS